MLPRCLKRLPVALAIVAGACSSEGTGASDVLVVSRIDIEPPGAGLVPGGTQLFTAVPKTSSGIAVPNRTVTWSSANPAIASVSTAGLVTANTLGETVVTATVDQVEASVPVNVTPKPVASVQVTPGSVTLFVNQTQPIQVTLKDAQGGTLTGRLVTYVSDDIQVATVSNDGLITAVAPGQTVVYTRSEGKEATTDVTVEERAAVRLAFTDQPDDATAGQQLAPVKVAVRDETGATVTSATDAVTLSLENNPGGGTLSGTLTVNAVAGVATFSNLRIDKSGAGYTLSATAGTLLPAISESFDISAGAAAALTMVTQPSPTAVDNEPFASQPTIRLVDNQGNPVAQAGVQVVATLVEETGGTLNGDKTVSTNSSGVAQFTDLSLSGDEKVYHIQFFSSGLSSVTSDGIMLGSPPPAATQLQMAVQPSSPEPSGVQFETQPQIQLADANGAAVSTSGVSVTAELASGSGTLLGTKTVQTNNSGRAVFTNLAISGSGTYTIRFTAAGLTAVISNPIAITAAAKLGFLVAPGGTTISGQVFAPAPQVQLLTADDVAVPQAGVPVAASILTSPAGSTPSLSGANAQTDGGGVATFSSLVLTGPPGNYTIVFSSAGLTPVTSGVITIPGPQQLVLNAIDNSARSGEALNPSPQLTVLDGAGHPVANIVVIVTVSEGAGLQGGTSKTSGANGVVTFTNLKVKADAGSYTLTFSIPAFPGVTPVTATVTIVP
jgi:hypothetical protein